MKKEKSFRKNVVGGFNPRDVVDYLAQISKERREEAEALRAGADKLRRERDAALAERVQAVLPEEGTEAGEREEFRIRFYEMRKERDELKERLDAVLAEREAERASIEQFRKEKEAFESDRDAVLETLTRRELEEAELVGERSAWLEERTGLLNERQALVTERDLLYERLAKLNDELSARAEYKNARTNAEEVRKETARLISETRTRYDEIMSAGRASALEIVLEIDRIRAFFARFTDRFAEMEQGIARLEGDPRPLVREFVPVTFADETGEQEQDAAYNSK